MIDPTPTQSREYSKLIEAEGPSQDAIDYKALQVLRGLSALDISDALHEKADEIKASIIEVGAPHLVGIIVLDAIHDYCQSIARRELEA